jgi:octaprenyl-diphosphate synthase
LNPATRLSQRQTVLEEVTAPISKPLDDAIGLLSSYMRNDVPFVDELLQHGNLLAGKRLRPVLLLLVAGSLGKIDQRHISLAAAIEMIHAATLVHDDILDGAQTRRHQPTIHEKWNNPTAVLLGDFLFSNAFYLASTTQCAKACELIGSATNLVCEGELLQLAATNHLNTSSDSYFDIISKKTGQLISCSTQLGTFFQQKADDESRWFELFADMESFGANLGIAFQIQDDILDIAGDAETTGKTLGTDLQNQKATLPIIHALDILSPEPRADLIRRLRNPNFENRRYIKSTLEQIGAIQFAKEQARIFSRRASDCLRNLPESECLVSLRLLTEFVTSRDC